MNEAHPTYPHEPSFNKQQLIREIIQTKAKIHTYQQLQSEINEISHHIISINDHPQPKNSTTNKSKSQISTKNTHKKVKIYELQKKYDKVAVEIRDKTVKWQKGRDYYLKIQESVQQKAKLIEDEKGNGQNLNKLQQQIQQQNGSTGTRLQAQSQRFLQGIKSKEVLSFERKRLRDEIRKLKMVRIGTLQFQIQQLQLSESLQQISRQEKAQLQAQGDIINKTNKYITQVSIGSFIRPSFNPFNHRRQSTDLSAHLEKQSHRIQALMNKIDIVEQAFAQMSSVFYEKRQQIAANQVLVKHHKITTGLSESQLANYYKMIEKTKTRISDNNREIESTSNMLRKYQGERGYMRGKIGIKIQEQRLIKGVNLLLEQDLQKVRKKLTYLILIRRMLRQKYE